MSIPKELRELELHFSASINLSPTDGDRFQLLYYTQLYDTLFSLFARFEVKQIDGDNDHIMINAVEFIGVNYKGHKNLEILEMEVSFKDASGIETEIEDLKKGYLNFNFTVSGTGSGTFTRLPEEHPGVSDGDEKRIMHFEDGIKVPKRSTYRLNRKLRSMSNFENKGVLNMPEDAFHEGSFDSEFFERDGFLISPINKLGRLFKFNVETDVQDHEGEGMRTFNVSGSGASINCPIGIGYTYST